MKDSLAASVASVVKNGNCSGCGLCAALFQSVHMSDSDAGFRRPTVSDTALSREEDSAQQTIFTSMCPGVVVRPNAEAGQSGHPVFGPYVEAWEGWATDDEVRFRGSSGGVLTAISAWIVERTGARTVLGVAPDGEAPSRTVPVRITSREEALNSAGSRYAPVSVLESFNKNAPYEAISGKPCEVSALRNYVGSTGCKPSDQPLLLAFFCAGTPSQLATERLIDSMGFDSEELDALSYRGGGWPGRFRVHGPQGSASRSYEESWGEHLGRQLQTRCKICVDATGESADIAVGDYWNATGSGFPVFEDEPGRSVILARTQRGYEAIMECVKEGILQIQPINLDDVGRVQPLQVKRRQTLAGRLLGRLLSFNAVPSYHGFGLFTQFIRFPKANMRAAVGMALRSRRSPNV